MEKILYKKDSSGKIRYLKLSTDGAFLVQESGVIDTLNPIINRSACEPKNVGKTNATTAEEQALSELQSKWTEKKRLGYFDSPQEAMQLGGADFLLPMLAKDFKKEVKKVKYPCFAQPKLDGMRALASIEDGFISRTGKAIDTIGHIVLPELPGVVLDGELYAHGISFQENMKLIKKYREGETEQVRYHVYDIVSEAPFNHRSRYILENLSNILHIEIVRTVIIQDYQSLLAFHRDNIAAGYEGTMVRHSEEGYQVNKRSSQLLKFKDFLDEVYEIVDVIPSEARPEQGIVVCKSGEQIFNCGMKFSHTEREDILRNRVEYIGLKAEIRFFEYTDGGLPRFPVCVGFREDK